MTQKSGEGRKSDAKDALKLKLVRDSFTMPKADYALIETLKSRSLETKRPAKKSELLRAGLHALAALSPEKLAKALDALIPLKAGRPKKAVEAPTAVAAPGVPPSSSPDPAAPKVRQAKKVAKSASPRKQVASAKLGTTTGKAPGRRPAASAPSRQRGPVKTTR